MFQVFNMGCRLEVYTEEKNAGQVASISKNFGIDARVIGRVEASDRNELVIRRDSEEIIYDFSNAES
jgi:phosphoribosylformylglycinamidine cyclo-ligase